MTVVTETSEADIEWEYSVEYSSSKFNQGWLRISEWTRNIEVARNHAKAEIEWEKERDITTNTFRIVKRPVKPVTTVVEILEGWRR